MNNVFVGGGCKKTSQEREWAMQQKADQARLEQKQKEREQYLLTPEGQAELQREQVAATRELSKITYEQWDTLFAILIDKGFQVDDVATMRTAGSIVATMHKKTDRPCIYVNASAIVDLYSTPGWEINPAHWREALVCFIKDYKEGTPIKKVRCVSRGPRSAWVVVVD